MIFNSWIFLVFFILFFQFYWLINNKLPIGYRNLFTILSSYLFYGWWDWRFLSLIIISSTIDYTVGLLLSKAEKKGIRQLYLITSIVSNLAILGFFKYFNFFIESLDELLTALSFSINIQTLHIILPVGISFYTFQTLSYTIDIYKGKQKPTKDIFSFFAFVAFFPQLVAGPIERSSRLLGQFQKKKMFNYEDNVAGLRLVLWGMFKKMVIADNLGVLADNVFNTGASISGITTLFGALLFAFQIYTDFSGYSDIAIGISKMLGMTLMQNFRTPYFSHSFSEFWHRWHISLSTWFRDYLYIPLGGNKGKAYRVSLNLIITFILSGLWHGAQITFVIWGALHGLLLLAEKKLKIKVNPLIAAPVVFIVVALLWIPFRAENLNHLVALTKSLFQFGTFSFQNIYTIIKDFSIYRFLFLMAVFVFFISIELKLQLADFNEWIKKQSKSTRFTIYYLLLVFILLLANFDVKPNFIYFQF